MAPPGTPGAAIIVMPSKKINPANTAGSEGMFINIITAMAQDVILSILPDKCTVAHNGITDPAIRGSTPHLIACRRVTGIVAAEDCVPNAVTYAVSMVRKRTNGFLRAISPAAKNWNNKRTTVIIKINTIIFRKMPRTCSTCPSAAIFKKIPYTNKGNNGMITPEMVLLITSLKPVRTFLRPSPLRMTVSPNPSTNAKTRADITPNRGGNSSVKYGKTFSAFSVRPAVVSEARLKALRLPDNKTG